MKPELLEIIHCPECRSDLELIAFDQNGAVVMEGLLACRGRDKHLYPIIRAIPRLLNEPHVWETEFVEKNERLLASRGFKGPVGELDANQIGTRRSFGYEWTTYQVQREEEDKEYFLAKTGFARDDLKGKLVLDAGCGSGRYAKISGEFGATVIGIDLSSAVETAYAVTEYLPNVHIIQGDILNLPFGGSTFDFIYSIGVLHHTPDTKKSLDCLIPLLKPNGQIAIWLYPRWPIFLELYNNFLRSISTRLSLHRLHQIAVSLEPVGRYKLKLLKGDHLVERIAGQLLRALTIGVSYHPDREIRICDTFDWFAPPYQWHHTDSEVIRWFRGYDLSDIVNLSEGQMHYQFNYGNGVNFKARRKVADVLESGTVGQRDAG